MSVCGADLKVGVSRRSSDSLDTPALWFLVPSAHSRLRPHPALPLWYHNSASGLSGHGRIFGTSGLGEKAVDTFVLQKFLMKKGPAGACPPAPS